MSSALFELVGLAVRQVREDTAPGRLLDEARVLDLEHGDHGARCLLDEARDQPQRLLRALADGHEGHVGHQLRRHGGDLGHLQLTPDHDMTELLHDLRRGLEAVRSLVGDEDAKGLGTFGTHARVAGDANFSARAAESEYP